MDRFFSIWYQIITSLPSTAIMQYYVACPNTSIKPCEHQPYSYMVWHTHFCLILLKGHTLWWTVTSDDLSSHWRTINNQLSVFNFPALFTFIYLLMAYLFKFFLFSWILFLLLFDFCFFFLPLLWSHTLLYFFFFFLLLWPSVSIISLFLSVLFFNQSSIFCFGCVLFHSLFLFLLILLLFHFLSFPLSQFFYFFFCFIISSLFLFISLFFSFFVTLPYP